MHCELATPVMVMQGSDTYRQSRPEFGCPCAVTHPLDSGRAGLESVHVCFLFEGFGQDLLSGAIEALKRSRPVEVLALGIDRRPRPPSDVCGR